MRALPNRFNGVAVSGDARARELPGEALTGSQTRHLLDLEGEFYKSCLLKHLSSGFVLEPGLALQ